MNFLYLYNETNLIALWSQHDLWKNSTNSALRVLHRRKHTNIGVSIGRANDLRWFTSIAPDNFRKSLDLKGFNQTILIIYNIQFSLLTPKRSVWKITDEDDPTMAGNILPTVCKVTSRTVHHYFLFRNFSGKIHWGLSQQPPW